MSNSITSFLNFKKTVTPNDIDREIQVWRDRKSGKLKNGWDWVAINYDADHIINVLEYGKSSNKSVTIICNYLFWEAEILNNVDNNNTNQN